MKRRGFLGSILAAGMAPAVARAGVLMPLGKVWMPPTEILTTAALSDPGHTHAMTPLVPVGAIFHWVGKKLGPDSWQAIPMMFHGPSIGWLPVDGEARHFHRQNHIEPSLQTIVSYK